MTEQERRIVIPEFEEWIKTHGVAFRPWTEQEESILREYYGKIPTKMIAHKLNRSIKSVQEKARREGICADQGTS
jgi:hypothetical protein